MAQTRIIQIFPRQTVEFGSIDPQTNPQPKTLLERFIQAGAKTTVDFWGKNRFEQARPHLLRQAQFLRLQAAHTQARPPYPKVEILQFQV